MCRRFNSGSSHHFERDQSAGSWHLSSMPKLTPTQIKTALPSVPQWKKTGGNIVRTYPFEDFVGAIKFVSAVAKLAEKACHHPDIDIRWNKVTLALSTHSEGGLTEKDFALAKKLDGLV